MDERSAKRSRMCRLDVHQNVVREGSPNCRGPASGLHHGDAEISDAESGTLGHVSVAETTCTTAREETRHSVNNAFERGQELQPFNSLLSEAESTMLRDEPPIAEDGSSEDDRLVTVAEATSQDLRGYIHKRAVELAERSGCQRGDVAEPWTEATKANVSTCGRLQAHVVAGIDMEGVYERQVEREHAGDNVGYALARSCRSNIKYEAARALGATGAGKQCKRGKCMAAALSIFAGKGRDGIPRSVVWALFQG